MATKVFSATNDEFKVRRTKVPVQMRLNMKRFMLLTFVFAFSALRVGSRQVMVDAESCESPQVISAVSAIYPQIAIKARVIGTVRVGIEVDENGGVIIATPSEGPGMLLAASKSAAQRWKFQPTGKRETGRLVFKFILFGSDSDPRDAGDAFFPPCKIEVRRSPSAPRTIY
jgi:TonB family protein